MEELKKVKYGFVISDLVAMCLNIVGILLCNFIDEYGII